MKKLTWIFFIEWSFIPSYDWYSMWMSNLVKILSKSKYFNIIVIHCYRGWSDIKKISEENFTTYFLSPDDYYNNIDLISNICKIHNPDFIQMQDAELIMKIWYKISNLIKTKLIYNIHFISADFSNDYNESSKKYNLRLKLEKHALNIADWILVLTPEDKNKILSFWINANKISVVPVVIYEKERKNLFKSKRGKNLLFLWNLFFKPNED